MVLEEHATPGVTEGIVWLDFVARIVAPSLRIANPNVKCGQLRLSLSFGFRSHPGKCINALAEGGDDVGDHFLGLGLGFRREIALHIKLADVVAKKEVHHSDAAPPTRTLLRRAGEGR